MMAKFIAGLFFCMLTNLCLGQMSAGDIALIGEKQSAAVNQEYYQRPGNDRHMLKTQHKGIVARYNPAALTLKAVMFTYQHVISPQLSRHCPYEITCSNFSKQSIQEYGIIKGVFLSADRILRCNRIGVLDVHPLDINERDGSIADSPNKYR